ncbi:lytic transglycosylase domain-containing protein [Magnetofaba australis]|nr:lytic transglycosylase domain-containing protein [Magnetofaba australis]
MKAIPLSPPPLHAAAHKMSVTGGAADSGAAEYHGDFESALRDADAQWSNVDPNVLDKPVVAYLLRWVRSALTSAQEAWFGDAEHPAATPRQVAEGASQPKAASTAAPVAAVTKTPEESAAPVIPAPARIVAERLAGPPAQGALTNLMTQEQAQGMRQEIEQAVAALVARNRQAVVAQNSADGDAPYAKLIAKAADATGLDADLLRAVIQTESGFDPKAVSAKGAKGLMQLMPATARELGVTDPFNPEQNVMAGARYLKNLVNRYQGEVDLALAAYNWGMGNLERQPERMPAETREYIAKIDRLVAPENYQYSNATMLA